MTGHACDDVTVLTLFAVVQKSQCLNEKIAEERHSKQNNTRFTDILYIVKIDANQILNIFAYSTSRAADEVTSKSPFSIVSLKTFRTCFKFLAVSFSTASKRIFARKHEFDSILKAPQDLHPFAPLQSQNFRKKSV